MLLQRLLFDSFMNLMGTFSLGSFTWNIFSSEWLIVYFNFGINSWKLLEFYWGFFFSFLNYKVSFTSCNSSIRKLRTKLYQDFEKDFEFYSLFCPKFIRHRVYSLLSLLFIYLIFENPRLFPPVKNCFI